MPVKSRVLSSGRWFGGESGYKVIVAVQQIGGYSRWGWPVYDGRMPAWSPATAPLLQLLASSTTVQEHVPCDPAKPQAHASLNAPLSCAVESTGTCSQK